MIPLPCRLVDSYLNTIRATVPLFRIWEFLSEWTTGCQVSSKTYRLWWLLFPPWHFQAFQLPPTHLPRDMLLGVETLVRQLQVRTKGQARPITRHSVLQQTVGLPETEFFATKWEWCGFKSPKNERLVHLKIITRNKGKTSEAKKSMTLGSSR